MFAIVSNQWISSAPIRLIPGSQIFDRFYGFHAIPHPFLEFVFLPHRYFHADTHHFGLPTTFLNNLRELVTRNILHAQQSPLILDEEVPIAQNQAPEVQQNLFEPQTPLVQSVETEQNHAPVVQQNVFEPQVPLTQTIQHQAPEVQQIEEPQTQLTQSVLTDNQSPEVQSSIEPQVPLTQVDHQAPVQQNVEQVPFTQSVSNDHLNENPPEVQQNVIEQQVPVTEFILTDIQAPQVQQNAVEPQVPLSQSISTDHQTPQFPQNVVEHNVPVTESVPADFQAPQNVQVENVVEHHAPLAHSIANEYQSPIRQNIPVSESVSTEIPDPFIDIQRNPVEHVKQSIPNEFHAPQFEHIAATEATSSEFEATKNEQNFVEPFVPVTETVQHNSLEHHASLSNLWSPGIHETFDNHNSNDEHIKESIRIKVTPAPRVIIRKNLFPKKFQSS